jgi:phosphate transport system ATP-binding protein
VIESPATEGSVVRLDEPATLVADRVSAWFGTHKVLEDLTLEMPARTITALIGPSGCGKSTFLRILNRMHELVPGAQLAGEVLLDGADIYGREIQATMARRPQTLVEECLTKAGLWREVKDRLHKMGGALSGGQQQRLCIARSLAVRPQVLLMDEPCSALDPTSTNRIEETMREIADEVTIVIVTHNMQQAQRVSQQCAFFNVDEGEPGRIVEIGPTEKIFSNPDDPRTEDYVHGRFG